MIQISQAGSLYILRGNRFKSHPIRNIIYHSLKIDFVLAYSADLDETQPNSVFHMRLFIWLFTVCHSIV